MQFPGITNLPVSCHICEPATERLGPDSGWINVNKILGVRAHGARIDPSAMLVLNPGSTGRNTLR